MARKDIIISFRVSESRDEELYSKLSVIPVSERNKMAKDLLSDLWLSIENKSMSERLEKLDILEVMDRKLEDIIEKIDTISLEGTLSSTRDREEHGKEQDSATSFSEDIIESMLGGW